MILEGGSLNNSVTACVSVGGSKKTRMVEFVFPARDGRPPPLKSCTDKLNWSAVSSHFND